VEPKIAFFDIDGTLIEGEFWRAVLRYPHLNRLKVAWFYLKYFPRVLLHRWNLLSTARFQAGTVISLAILIKNWQRQEVNALFDWVVQDQLVYREDVLALLRAHKAKGVQVFLVTELFVRAGRRMARRVGADGAIGTGLIWDSGMATGSIKRSRACVGSRKLDFIRHYIQKKGIAAELHDCIGYADTDQDAVWLAALGTAVAVYPDVQLRQAAQEQGWAVFPE